MMKVNYDRPSKKQDFSVGNKVFALIPTQDHFLSTKFQGPLAKLAEFYKK